MARLKSLSLGDSKATCTTAVEHVHVGSGVESINACSLATTAASLVLFPFHAVGHELEEAACAERCADAEHGTSNIEGLSAKTRLKMGGVPRSAVGLWQATCGLPFKRSRLPWSRSAIFSIQFRRPVMSSLPFNLQNTPLSLISKKINPIVPWMPNAQALALSGDTDA